MPGDLQLRNVIEFHIDTEALIALENEVKIWYHYIRNISQTVHICVAELSIWFRGCPASVGSFTEGPAGTYTITATGWDIAGTADAFHYAYKTLTGVGSIEA